MEIAAPQPSDHRTPSTPRPSAFPRWWWSRVELSPNTHRSFSHVAPVTRGWLHRLMAFAWPLVLLRLVWISPPGRARAGAIVFGLAMQVMFTASALTHLRRWGVWTTEVLFRFDHIGIFLAIGGSTTPVALLALDGWMRVTVLVLAWTAAAIGIFVLLHPARTPHGFGLTAFISAGALVVPFLPVIAANVGVGGLVLLGTGAVTYVVGAVLLALQRPQVRSRVFGYHEVWHGLVVAGVLQHTFMLEGWLLPLA